MSFSVVVARDERGRSGCVVNRFLVSKETMVLHQWERSKQKFGFIE